MYVPITRTYVHHDSSSFIAVNVVDNKWHIEQIKRVLLRTPLSSIHFIDKDVTYDSEFIHTLINFYVFNTIVHNRIRILDNKEIVYFLGPKETVIIPANPFETVSIKTTLVENLPAIKISFGGGESEGSQQGSKKRPRQTHND